MWKRKLVQMSWAFLFTPLLKPQHPMVPAHKLITQLQLPLGRCILKLGGNKSKCRWDVQILKPTTQNQD